MQSPAVVPQLPAVPTDVDPKGNRVIDWGNNVIVHTVTDDAGDLAADRARVESLRRSLGARLATYRTAAGVFQPDLGRAVGRTRSTISKIEHGTSGLESINQEFDDRLVVPDCAGLSGIDLLLRLSDRH